MSRKLTKEEYHRFRGEEKRKHIDSMACGDKKPDERARELFRRPPYPGLFSGGGIK